MFKNYFKVAIRNFWGDRFFSFINIIGLAIGIGASLVIYLFVSYDFSFDKFEKDNNRICRVTSAYGVAHEVFKSAGVPYPLYDVLRKEVTGVGDVAAIKLWHGGYRGLKVSVKNSKGGEAAFPKQEHIVFADENYFSIIPYTWLAGSAKTSLQKPYNAVLTASAAKLYFPGVSASDVLGKEVYFDDTVRMVVTGVVQDVTENTDFTFKVFVSRASLETARLMPEQWNGWGSTDPASQLFTRLLPGITPSAIKSQLAKLSEKYDKENASRHITTEFGLQPLSDIHFNAEYDNYNPHVASKPVLYSLLAVAAFLLLLACVNFINLTTAKASKRAKEIGIRKTMGSSAKQLRLQFLGETFLLTLIAAILSVALVPLLVRAFSGFFPQGFHVDYFDRVDLWIFLLALIVSVSFLAGFYPALVLSSYKPALVLKGQSVQSKGETRSAVLRKTLTALQFVIAEILIVATAVVGKQITYELTADMGFKKEGIIYFDTNYSDNVKGHRPLLRDKLKAIPGVAMVSLSNAPASLSGGIRGGQVGYSDGHKNVVTTVKVTLTDTNFIHVYQLMLLAGNNLPVSDTIKSILINEACAKILGFKNPQDAVGKYIDWNDWGPRKVPIAGVVNDYHLRSFHEEVKPMIISSKANQQLLFSVALQPQNADGTAWRTAIRKIEKAFKEMYPDDAFDYSFMDETVAKYYAAEESTAQLLAWATGLCIVISCLGLLGLAMYTIKLRAKEIGVRKVLGATVMQLSTLLSKDFLKPVLYAFVIAAPIAWYMVNKWLEGFAYKINVQWWVFLAGGVAAVLVAMITISFQTIKAALENPVKALRAE